MNLNDLIREGAVVPSDIEKRTVTWSKASGVDDSGKPVYKDVTFSVHIKRVSYGVTERVLKGISGDPDRSYNASLIAESVLLGDEPYEKFTYEQAYSLDSGLALALIKEIGAVNRREPEKK